ncbi:MAG: SLC13 family permease [Eubacterium sp.]
MNSAVLSLIIFGICIVLFVWDKLPMATSAILGCAAMVLFGVCDFETAFGQFASTTVLMLIGVFVVGSAVAETGVAAKIGNLLTKLTKNSERAVIAISFVLAMALSTFLTNVTVLAIFIPIMFALAKENKHINPMNIVIPLTLAVNMGGITTLVGSSQQMTAQGLLQEYGYKGFEVFDFTLYGIILGIAALVYILLIGYPLGKKIWGNREINSEYNDVQITKVEVNKRKEASIIIIFILMVFLYIYQKIPFTDIEVPPHVTSTLAALACIITGCISQKKAIKNINWNIVGRLAGCLGLAKALSASGGIDLISSWFMKLVGTNFSPLLLFIILVALSQILSLFISNSTSISVVLLVVMSIAPELSLNVPAFAMGIVLSSSMGACCPLSGSTWGISMAAGYRFRDYFKYGIAIDLISLIIIIISVPLTMGLTV